MADLKEDGTPLEVKGEAVPPTETSVSKEEKEIPATEAKAGIELRPSYVQSGNELVVIVKMLESLNKNLAFLATTIHKHLNPEK
jgi:ABC-type uncharacterized transport system substrate-binding protein